MKIVFKEIIDKCDECDINELIQIFEKQVNKNKIINDQARKISDILRDNDKLNIPTKDVLDIVGITLKENKNNILREVLSGILLGTIVGLIQILLSQIIQIK